MVGKFEATKKRIGDVMDPIKDVKKHDFRSAPLSTKEATISNFRSTRVRLFLCALLLCACGSAMASTPFVIQGPTVVQNNCMPSFACASISYPANSAITSNGRVVQANTGSLEFDIPVVSNIPNSAAGLLQVTFAVTATATGGASGEVQSNSAKIVMAGTGSGTLKIPVPVEWAESEVRFQITYSVSGTKVICNGKLGCKIYPFVLSNSSTGPNLSSIALGIPAPQWLNGTQQPAGPIPADAFMVLVTPQVAFQLLLQPVGIVYAPVGNAPDAKSNLTFSEASGTNLQFMKSQSSAMGLTQDDRTNYQGNVTYSFSLLGSSLLKLGFNFSGYWDNAVENDQQLSSTTSILTTNQQISSLGVTNYPESGEPPFNQITYLTQPFWDDLILAVVNPHFAIWSYPTGAHIQPIGNDANLGIVELRIRRLDECVNTPAAIQPTSSTAGTWQPGQAYSVGAMILVENSYVQVATTTGVSGAVAPTWATANGSTTTDGGVTWTNESAHLIPVNAMPGVQYDWLASSDCANFAKVDQFWVKKSQSATPYSDVADLSFTGTDDTSALTTYSTENSFSNTYTQSSSLQTAAKVTSVGSSSLGVTADVSGLLQDLGISLGVGTTSTTTETYSNVSTQTLQAAQTTEHVVAATNSVHDTMNPPAEIVVNALLDTYFEGIALQVPSMQLTPPPAAAIRPAMAQVEAPVEENSPSYMVVKPEGTVDQEVVEQAREAASLRHPDEPLPVPEPGKAVLHRPAQH
jgi:hypothetical protein